MFNREFIQSKLGKASVASIAAMTLFVALSTQMHIAPAVAAIPVASGLLVEMADSTGQRNTITCTADDRLLEG